MTDENTASGEDVNDTGLAGQTPQASIDAAGGQPGTGQAEAQADGGAEGQEVPEVYDFSVPEGFEALDEQTLAKFDPIARELNLSQEQAQKLVELYGGAVSDAQTRAATGYAAQVEAWETEVKTDRVLGGDALDRNLGVAVSALNRFGTPELREALDRTGMGSHPEFVRFAFNVGRSIAEDRAVSGGRSPGGRPADLGEALYGKS